jgi:hypothetical protein
MTAFQRASGNTFSTLGQDLKKRISMQVIFHELLPQTTMKAISIEGQSDLMPSMDKFLCNFNPLYLTSEAFRGNLMVGLMTTFVAKLRSTVRECSISCWCFLQAVTEKLSSLCQPICALSQYNTLPA